MSEQDEKAKNWEMVEQRQKLKAEISRLVNELRSYAESWRELSGTISGDLGVNGAYRYRVDSTKIEVLNQLVISSGDTLHRSPGFKVIAGVSSKHFNLERITTLLSNLSDSRDRLAKVEVEILDAGGYL